MRKIPVLIEFNEESVDFDEAGQAVECISTRETIASRLVKQLDKVGLEYSVDESSAIPLFQDHRQLQKFSAAGFTEAVPKRGAWVLPATIDASKVSACKKGKVKEVWPCSKMSYIGKDCGCGSQFKSQDHTWASTQEAEQNAHATIQPSWPRIGAGVSPEGWPSAGIPLPQWPRIGAGLEALVGTWNQQRLPDSSVTAFDLARSDTGNVDCFSRPAVTLDTIRTLLGVERIWFEGFRGQNVVVGILDNGVNGNVYPVIGGFSLPGGQAPGSASIQSHGSMCAADILVAAPQTKLMDYPFLGDPDSGSALTMFHAILNERRERGIPHLTNNSYGFVGISDDPMHEVNNINHPVHRKIREVVASGASCFFAAGNCGAPCPDGRCHSSAIGAGNSISAGNALSEVITVGAVNAMHERIGYSAQGPGHAHPSGFEKCKPDFMAYSHFFGNFGPGRPAGGTGFDSGTSAACPVAAGVGALLLSAFPDLQPSELKGAMIRTAIDLGTPGFDFDSGHGVINAAAAFRLIDWSDDLSELIAPAPDC